MTEDEIIRYLDENGYPPHIVRGGSAGLRERWTAFVQEVEQGYPYGLDDYRHDLEVRAAIEILGLREDATVRQADAHLAKLLTATASRVWESSSGDPFWDFGYPQRLRPRLRNDLARAGLLQTDETE